MSVHYKAITYQGHDLWERKELGQPTLYAPRLSYTLDVPYWSPTRPEAVQVATERQQFLDFIGDRGDE